MKKPQIRSRGTVDKIIALSGIGVVFLQLLLYGYSSVQVLLVTAGVFMIFVGVWRVASQMLPDRRKNPKLRIEVDKFIVLVRALNAREPGSGDQSIDEIKSAIHDSVSRVISATGVVEETV
jgi:hypothetical protein